MTNNSIFATIYVAQWDRLCLTYLENFPKIPHKVIDIDENLDIAVAERITAIPTTKFYVDGELRLTKLGCGTTEVVQSWINEIEEV